MRRMFPTRTLVLMMVAVLAFVWFYVQTHRNAALANQAGPNAVKPIKVRSTQSFESLEVLPERSSLSRARGEGVAERPSEPVAPASAPDASVKPPAGEPGAPTPSSDGGAP